MPKLKNRPPKYSKQGKYAVVHYNRRYYYLGRYGSPESKEAYSRFLAEIQASSVFSPPSGEKSITVGELAASFLDHAKLTLDPANYSFYRIVVLDFLVKLYGTGTSVDEFKPSCLKKVRELEEQKV